VVEEDARGLVICIQGIKNVDYGRIVNGMIVVKEVTG
jgi:hypothetical protein